MQHYPDKLPVVARSLGAGSERRGEGVVHEPRIRPVRRDGRGRIIASVFTLLDLPGCPPVFSTGVRGSEHDVLVVQAIAAIHPREHELVSGVIAARSTVRYIRGGGRREVGPGTSDAILDATADRGLEVVTRIVGGEDVARARPVLAAVEGFDHLYLTGCGRHRVETELV